MNELKFETKIQLLVDGELAHADRSKLLLQIDGQSTEQATSQWKQLALAFVEQQIINESLTKRELLRQDNVAIPREDCPSTKMVSDKAVPNQWRWLSLVTALTLGWLLAGVLGYQLLQGPNESNSISPLADARQPTEPITPELSGELTLADAIARSARPIPPSFRREMLKAGYLVNENLETTSVDLPIGGTIDIPIRTIDIEFLGIAAFQ